MKENERKWKKMKKNEKTFFSKKMEKRNMKKKWKMKKNEKMEKNDEKRKKNEKHGFTRKILYDFQDLPLLL